MSRSSRHKKHSYKDDRGRSDSEEDRVPKSRNGGDEVLVRVSRDLASVEKRKLTSLSQDGKDIFSSDNNVDMFEDYVASKRRKERVDVNVTDRWKGVEEERGKRETKGEGFVDSNSKSSRRHESLIEIKEENAGFNLESGEAKRSVSSKVEAKRKSEKDFRRKEVAEFGKDAKDKERGGSEKDRKVQDGKHDRSVDSEMGRKRGSQSGYIEEERRVKQEVENTEWQLHHELPNPDLEKELEYRMKTRRDGSAENDKYQDDKRYGNNSGLSPRKDRAKTGKDKYERSDRDKYKDDRYRDKYREDMSRDYRHRDDKRRDDRSTRDYMSDRPDTKYSRDESKTVEYRNKRSKPQDSDRDGTPHRDDQGARYKDIKGKKRSPKDHEIYSDLKSPSTAEHRSDVEYKTLSSGKSLSLVDKGRSQSRRVDVDSIVSSSKWTTSPSSSAHIAKDQYRSSSKQAESKYRDSMSKEKVELDIASSREPTGFSGGLVKVSESHPMEKKTRKDDKYLLDMSNERPRRSDAQVPSMQFMEKSPSSSSIDRRYSTRSTVRRSLDVEETAGRNSGSKDARDYSANEDRRSRDLPSEKQAADQCFQPDRDTLSISSSFNKTSHLPSNSSSLLPPPSLRSGVDSPSVFVSLEEDSRGKPSNRYRRNGDPNVGRGLGNAWKGVPNWPSPVTNGFIPYPHGPPPGGLHAVMHPFPAHLFGVRPSMELNHGGMPYHISDADRFAGHGRSFGWRNPADGSFPSHLHGWDGRSGVLGDESQMYAMPSWDQNRHLMSGRGWELNNEMWKGQNGGMNMELPPAVQKDHHLQRVPADEPCSGQSGRSRKDRDRPSSHAESIEIKPFSCRPPEKESTEASVKAIHEKMPRPSEISHRDDACFCHVYLSKLDISVDLTHPKLYNRCLSMLGERNAASYVTKHVNPEECSESGSKIWNNTSSASFFPKINDSIFQKAMALYKKQAEETMVKPYISSLAKSKLETLPTADGETQEPVQATAQEMQIRVSASTSEILKTASVSDHEKVEEPIPTSDQERAEDPIPNSNGEKAEESAPTSGQEEPIPAFNQEKAEEPIPTPDHEKTEELIQPSDQEKVEVAVPASYEEKAEEPIPILEQEKKEAADPASYLEKAEEPTPVSDWEKVEEVVPVSHQEKAEEAISNQINAEEEASAHEQNVEGVTSTHNQNAEEPIAVPMEEKAEEPDPTTVEENVESTVTLEKLEGTVEDRSSFLEHTSPASTDSPFTEEDIIRASDCRCDHSANSSKEHSEAFDDPVFGTIGFSEGCVALMPESIECGSVNLSRIHQFSENTH